MKAILVIDEMPKTCDECRLNIEGICGATDERIYSIRCPLKPLPQKKEVEVNKIEDLMHTEFSIEDIYTNKYIATIRLATDKLISLGWNACLEEIEE